MSTPEKISQRMKLLREQAGLTQEQFAHELGFTRSYVSQIEAGAKEPGPRFEREVERWASQQASAQQQASGARGTLRKVREDAGLSRAELAKRIERPLGYLQALEEGAARISEDTADRICEALPAVDRESLLTGSDHPPVNGGDFGMSGTKPQITTPPDIVARYVPLISWAQCGSVTDFEDIYDYEGYVAFNVLDPRAIAVRLRGDSMEPRFKEGDVAIIYPSRKPQTGNLVIAKVRDEGVVFKKFQIISRKPSRFRFISENPVYQPIERDEEEIEWIYPVANVVNNLL